MQQLYRWDIINKFIQQKNYKRYLEIGYYKGWSFDRVNCANKTAVDPNPSKMADWESMGPGSWRLKGDESETMYKMTSDEFFEQLPSGTLYDIVFIDGLHEAEQVQRDFHNAVRHLAPGGTIVFHDCNPTSEDMTKGGTPSGEWTGDVYRTAIWIRPMFPYNFYVVDTDYGVGVYRDDEVVKKWFQVFGHWADKPLTHMTWDAFDKGRKELLNLITVEEFLDKEK